MKTHPPATFVLCGRNVGAASPVVLARFNEMIEVFPAWLKPEAVVEMT